MKGLSPEPGGPSGCRAPCPPGIVPFLGIPPLAGWSAAAREGQRQELNNETTGPLSPGPGSSILLLSGEFCRGRGEQRQWESEGGPQAPSGIQKGCGKVRMGRGEAES